MLICHFRKKLLVRIKDVYFAPCAENFGKRTDVTQFFQCAQEIPDAEKLITLHIDLKRDEEEMLQSFNRRTKTDLKKARESGCIECEQYVNPSGERLHEFVCFFNEFASAKGIEECDLEMLEAINETKALMISVARISGDKICCMHAHSFDENRARAIYSCSARFEEAMKEMWHEVARANRYLHWKDMLFFREKGIPLYDFGGLSLNEDPAKKSVDEFKLGFGGEIVTEYNFFKAHTLAGRLALGLMKLLKR